jgi:excisionase family DNA binding protein
VESIKVTTDDLLSVGRAAKSLNISRVWLYELIKNGKVNTIRLGGILFVPNSEVERLKRESKKSSRLD